MKMFKQLFAPAPKRLQHKSSREVETRFLRLYSMWHETHDLTLRKRLYVKLRLVMRQIPNFDLRSRFQQAF
ncbi:MAG: hypothetical protein A3C35_00735 [Omnitrophica bacterium RIFCSPHIGHO2_02_FULL_46_11]|nr:MAG: hypothetical protein A3C35_00735 [Omnitrophica bacterium RIFCSPHIGHO2_02_FULL_46_11]OGW87689.1 MAG: hypothetical protein A3A81_04105 [Omnitrophica bacterium RIFCSPLOWO2_01_FULL_45_10b]